MNIRYTTNQIPNRSAFNGEKHIKGHNQSQKLRYSPAGTCIPQNMSIPTNPVPVPDEQFDDWISFDDMNYELPTVFEIDSLLQYSAGWHSPQPTPLVETVDAIAPYSALCSDWIWPSFSIEQGTADTREGSLGTIPEPNTTLNADVDEVKSIDSPILKTMSDTFSWASSPKWPGSSPSDLSYISFTSSAINTPSRIVMSVSPQDTNHPAITPKTFQDPPKFHINGNNPVTRCTGDPVHARENKFGGHNIPVDHSELEECLNRTGQADKVQALRSALTKVTESIEYRNCHGSDQGADARLPPEVIKTAFFAPFLEKRRVRDKDGKGLFYVCLFCEHGIRNRTQMIQHIMGRHFRYYPHECGVCDATFCRPADLKKHEIDIHFGERVPCHVLA